MIDSKAQRERRGHKRYLARFGSFYVHSPHWNDIYGEILDISRSGLSCCYMSEKPLSNSYVTGILFDNGTFRLDDLVLKTVSDYRIATSSIAVRRRSIQFCDISPAQIEQIERFIRAHKLRVAPRS